MEDVNINISKQNLNGAIPNFLELICSSVFAPYTLQPARCTSFSATLIDNVVFKAP